MANGTSRTRRCDRHDAAQRYAQARAFAAVAELDPLSALAADADRRKADRSTEHAGSDDVADNGWRSIPEDSPTPASHSRTSTQREVPLWASWRSGRSCAVSCDRRTACCFE
jgi:hypothetical protein